MRRGRRRPRGRARRQAGLAEPPGPRGGVQRAPGDAVGAPRYPEGRTRVKKRGEGEPRERGRGPRARRWEKETRNSSLSLFISLACFFCIFSFCFSRVHCCFSSLLSFSVIPIDEKIDQKWKERKREEELSCSFLFSRSRLARKGHWTPSIQLSSALAHDGPPPRRQRSGGRRVDALCRCAFGRESEERR